MNEKKKLCLVPLSSKLDRQHLLSRAAKQTADTVRRLNKKINHGGTLESACVLPV